MNREEALSTIRHTLDERLFSAIKRMYIYSKKEKFCKIAEYQNADSATRKEILDEKYKFWYRSIESFYLSFHSIFALGPLVRREKQILDFDSQLITVVKTDYRAYDGIEFSATHPTRFTIEMKKELEDCILDLSNPKFSHVVDNYKPENDTEKSPHEPLTIATLKYNCYYLFQFDYKYTTNLATLLFNAGLITNPFTNGWNIDNAVIEDIITVLYSFMRLQKEKYPEKIKHPENAVLTHKRKYTDQIVDRSDEAIRPIFYSQRYSPESIADTNEFKEIEFENGREKEDAKKLYEFIYNITLSTQLKNSIYDTSSVDIMVGHHKLRQKAHRLLDGQDNWELMSGKYIKQIEENDNTEQGQSKTVVLPEFRPGDVLSPISSYPYTYNSRRPRRFGVGRFAAQILEKDGIGFLGEHDSIISNLIDSKAVITIQRVLNPQEISIFFIDWLSVHAPILLNLDYMKEVDEKIESVINNEFTLDSLIEEFNRIIDEAFVSANYVEDTSKPSQSKINLLNSIASKYGLVLEQDIYESNAKCDLVLSQYKVAEPIKVGSCPECNAVVYQKEYIKKETGETLAYFSCEKFNKTNGCSFSIWDSSIEKFFSEKGINLYTVEERKEALRKIISRKKGYLFSGFIDESRKKYDAKIGMSSFVPKSSRDKKVVWFLKIMKKEDSSDLVAANEDVLITNNKTLENSKQEEVREIKPSTKEDFLARQIKELEEKNKLLEQQHLKDYLTGAFNRNSLDKDLETFWLKGMGGQISIAFIDGDNFKSVNDTYSHLGGDTVLKALVQRFTELTKNIKARVYKFGGDEFCILFREEPDVVNASMELIRRNIKENPIPYNDQLISTTITAGVACNIGDMHWKELLKIADEMLYDAKAKGKNTYSINI